MNKPPSYPHFAQDWLAGTAHLSLEAQGAYQRLLDHEWVGGKWVGPLSDDPVVLARLLGVTRRRFDVIWREIGQHFPRAQGGGLYNDRLERERLIQEGFRVAKSVAGKAGADKRWDAHVRRDGRRHAAAIALPMAQSIVRSLAEGMAKNALSSSSSPSSSPGKIRVESRVEGRPSDPEKLSELLGGATSQGRTVPGGGAR